MGKTPTQTLPLGWVRAQPKLSAGPQIAALLARGIPERDITIDGAKLASGRRANWDWLLKKLRPGDTLYVTHLRAIYAQVGNLTPRQALLRPLHQVEDKGCIVVELSTGRRSNVKRDCEMMIADALDAIARASRGGRRRKSYTEEELALVDKHWPSTRHRTNQSAVDAIHAVARERGHTNLLRLTSVQAFINVFKGSGRERIKRK